MHKSQALSEKAIKKLGLDKRTEPNLADRSPVKEWDEEIKAEIDRRIAAMSEEEKKSIPENELRYKVYNEVWDGSGIEGWWD